MDFSSCADVGENERNCKSLKGERGREGRWRDVMEREEEGVQEYECVCIFKAVSLSLCVCVCVCVSVCICV